MKICIDTNVLIDILKDEFPAYQERFYTAFKNEKLAAPTVVYAELMPQFKGNTKLLNSFLSEHKIKIEPLDVDSVILAGEKWMKYLKIKSKVKCPRCGNILNVQEHFLSDFYIGGYALTKCDAILTRDRGIYKKYFPELQNY